jgi:hypothetical protein
MYVHSMSVLFRFERMVKAWSSRDHDFLRDLIL